MEMFTFGVYSEDTVRAIEAGAYEGQEDQALFDEIDVQAHTASEAQRLARVEADRDYGPGSKLFPLPPGGSGGLVQSWRL